MGKAKEILEGWANLVIKKDFVEVVAQYRLDICNKCEYNSKRHKSNRPDVHCTKCGCTLAAKVRSMESECPIAKWPKHKNNEKRRQT